MNNESLNIQEFYNDIAQEFADDWYKNDSLLPILQRFMKLLPHTPRVLDLGCGAGYESRRLKSLGANVVGIDYSEEPIKIARQKNPDCQFEIMDFRKISAEIGFFNGIIAIASLIHIKDEELMQVFRSMKSVLTSDGYIMIILIEGDGLSEELSNIERDNRKYRRNFYLHNRARLSEISKEAGLEFLDEWELPEELSKIGWKCFLYQLK